MATLEIRAASVSSDAFVANDHHISIDWDLSLSAQPDECQSNHPGLPPADDLWNFLCQLKPLGSGKIECKGCRCSILADIKSIFTHFLTARLINGLYFATQPECLQFRILSYFFKSHHLQRVWEIIGDASRMSASTLPQGTFYPLRRPLKRSAPEGCPSLPNIQNLVHCLKPTADGMMTCSHTRCATIPPFDADRSRIVEHIWKRHCPHLQKSANFDESSLQMAIFSRLEEYGTYLIIEEILTTAEDNAALQFGPKISSPLHNQLSNLAQWKVLRQLRKVFTQQDQKLARFACARKTRNYTLLKISTADCGDKLEAAILTLHDINSNKSPTDLGQIVRFINLSFSMAEVLKRNGHFVSFMPSRADFQTWRNCLTNKAELRAFDELMKDFWTVGIFSDGPVNSEYGTTVMEPKPGQMNFQFLGMPCSNSTEWLEDIRIPEQTNSITSFMNDISKHEDFDFSVFTNIRFSDTSIDIPAPLFTPRGLLGTRSILDTNTEMVTGSRHTPETGIQNTTDLLDADYVRCGSTLNNDPALRLDSKSMIQATIIFLQVLLFLACKTSSILRSVSNARIVLVQLGDLLKFFSPAGITPYQNMSEQTSIAALNNVRFAEQARYRVLNPLRLDNRFEDILPLIVVTTELLEIGWLRSVRDLETYLLSIAEVCIVSVISLSLRQRLYSYAAILPISLSFQFFRSSNSRVLPHRF